MSRFVLVAGLVCLVLGGCGSNDFTNPSNIAGNWTFQVMSSDCPFLAGLLSAVDGFPNESFAVNQTGSSVNASFADQGGNLCSLEGTYDGREFRGVITVEDPDSERTIVVEAIGSAQEIKSRRNVDGTLFVLADSQGICDGAKVGFWVTIQGEGEPVVRNISIVGCVEDVEEPIGGATVSISETSLSTTTASDGTFTLNVSNLPGGTYQIFASDEDFSGSMTVSIPSGNITRTITLPDCIVIRPAGEAQTCEFDVLFQRDARGVAERVDVFFLFDDTGSFAAVSPTVRGVFQDIVGTLRSEFPNVDFAFGVGRFEEYGGPGEAFAHGPTPAATTVVEGMDTLETRPFILNQPITLDDDPNFNSLLEAALDDEAPGVGADLPEAFVEALYQVATGDGFDGDGDQSLNGGPTSGDVPAFEGTADQGGVGWRPGSFRIVVLATDNCPVTVVENQFSGDPFESTVTGLDGITASIEEIACPVNTSTIGSASSAYFNNFLNFIQLGQSRFGFAGDGKSPDQSGETIEAVAPQGAAEVQNTVDALVNLGIHVIGMSSRLSLTEDDVPVFDPFPINVLPAPDESGIRALQAFAKLTGAVTDTGVPLVFPIPQAGSATSLFQQALTDSLRTTLLSLDAPPLDVTYEFVAASSNILNSSINDEGDTIQAGGSGSFGVTVTFDNATAPLGIVRVRGPDGSVIAEGTVTLDVECDPSFTGIQPDPNVLQVFPFID